MSGTHGRSFADLEIYKRYESLSDRLWDIVESWAFKYQKRIGDQMLDAIDSVGANTAESVGRGHVRDGSRFLFYARGSLHETEHWVRVAKRRGLICDGDISALREDFVILAKQLNAFIRSQRPPGKDTSRVKEDEVCYGFVPFMNEPQCRGNGSGRSRKRSKIKSRKPRAKSQEPRAKKP